MSPVDIIFCALIITLMLSGAFHLGVNFAIRKVVKLLTTNPQMQWDTLKLIAGSNPNVSIEIEYPEEQKRD